MAIFQDFGISPLVKDKLNNVTNFSGTIMKASRNISLEICSILDDLFIFISLHSLRISSLSVVISINLFRQGIPSNSHASVHLRAKFGQIFVKKLFI